MPGSTDPFGGELACHGSHDGIVLACYPCLVRPTPSVGNSPGMVLMTARGPCAYALPMLGLTEQDFCRAWVSRGRAYALPMPGLTEQDFCRAWVSRGLFGRLGGLLS